MYVIGIDPGPVVGIVRLRVDYDSDPYSLREVEAVQATHGLVLEVLEALNRSAPAAVAVERFIVGPRSARSSTPTGGAAAREVIELVRDWATSALLPAVYTRSAAEVKPWATDARLAAAGLLEPTIGMRHARDAARHALFCAVKAYSLPDPLSTRARAR